MKTQKTIGAAVLSLSLLVGLSGFAGAVDGSIENTGPRSYNTVKSEIERKIRVWNDNDLRLDNDNYQRAYTGDARTSGNTTGGDAESGNASNSNALHVTATVDNSASADDWADVLGGAGGGESSGSIEQTGPRSVNKVTIEDTTEVSINNDNDIRVDNDNNQRATSGDARVSGNTTGGDATTGNATNTNTTTVNLTVRN
jgi:hypothetical protein